MVTNSLPTTHMKKAKRDLLVLLKQELMTPQAIEQEIDNLHRLLYSLERTENFVTAHELIDLNRYKIFKSDFEIRKLLRSKKEKAFLFLNNLN